MATATGFTYTGTGGFTSAMSVARTFTCGTTGGTTSNAPNLTFTTGAGVPTFTSGSWFNQLDFGSIAAGVAATTLNVNGITLTTGSVGGAAYTSVIFNIVGSGTLTGNGKTFGAVNLLAGSPTITDTVSCTTFTVNGGAWDFTTGTLTPSTSFVLTSGSFTYNGGTLSAVPTFTHTAGTVTFNYNYSLTTAGTYTFSIGTLIISAGVTLNTGIFSSSSNDGRAIVFGSSSSAGNINLTSTTIASTVLNMAILTSFVYSGIGGFTVADMTNTRTFTCGTTGGTSTNAPNLTFTTGASVATITSGSYFNKLDYGTTSFTQAATTLNVNSITLSSSGTYTALILNLVGSGTLTYNGKTTAAITLLTGSPTFADTITCTTFTVNGPDFNFTSGTLNPSTSFVLTSGSFTFNGGTLGAVPTFTHTAGTVTFNYNYSLTTTGTYTFTAGTLTLANGVTLNTGIFASTNTNTRAIAFGSSSAGNINLTHTTAATVVLSMAILTGFTYTGTGGFTVADMANTRTFTCGTTGGSLTTAPNLTFTTGSSIATLTTASWFNKLDFGTTAFTIAATSLNIAGDLTLSSSGTYTNLTITMVDTGTATFTTNGKTISALTINGTNGVFNFTGAATVTNALTLTAGTIYTSGNITSGTFASTGTATRGIIGGNITYTISGSGASAFSNASATGLTMSGLTISMTSATAKTFAGGGATYPVLNNGGAGALTISGSNTFDTISNSVQPTTFTFTIATTQTVNSFNVAGIAGSLVTINSSTATSTATLSKPSGIVYGSYLTIRDSTATGGATWYAGPTSTNTSNNTGWVFTQLPIINMGNLTVTAGGFVISNDPVV
jgi:hypothetical protein